MQSVVVGQASHIYVHSGICPSCATCAVRVSLLPWGPVSALSPLLKEDNDSQESYSFLM